LAKPEKASRRGNSEKFGQVKKGKKMRSQSLKKTRELGAKNESVSVF